MAALLYGVFGSQQSDLPVFSVVLVAGFVIGVFGHVIKSRTLILTGIIVIALTTAYFGFVVAKVR